MFFTPVDVTTQRLFHEACCLNFAGMARLEKNTPHPQPANKVVREWWQFYFYGWIPFITPWVAVYWAFYDSVSRSDPGPPEWVKWIVWTLLITFASFAGCMFYFIRHYDDPLISYKTEVWYAILSLVSKTLLAWQLYIGAYVRTKNGIRAYQPYGNVTAIDTPFADL